MWSCARLSAVISSIFSRVKLAVPPARAAAVAAKHSTTRSGAMSSGVQPSPAALLLPSRHARGGFGVAVHARAVASCERDRRYRDLLGHLRLGSDQRGAEPVEIGHLLVFAVQKNGYVHRTIVCQIINGMDSRIWHSMGMCTRTTRTPISFNVVERQTQRVEKFPQIAQTPIHLP